MAYIMEQIKQRKANVAVAVEDAHSGRVKAAPRMTIREPFEGRVERELKLTRDHSEQYAQKIQRRTTT